MSLRLWLIFFGILVFALIGFDAWRKSKRDSTEELDEHSFDADMQEAECKRRQLQQELPYGKSRKLGELNTDYDYAKSFEVTFDDDPIPLLNNPLDANYKNSDKDLNSQESDLEKIKTKLELSEQEAPVDFAEPKLDIEEDKSNIQDELDFAQQFDLEQSYGLAEDENFSENLFELPLTKGLIELEKDLWRKSEESIFIRIVAEENQEYNLAEFWDFCSEADLRLSERGFVHRFLEGEDRNYIQFSIINAVEPGNFLMLNKLNTFTKGLIFVQTLPGGFAPVKILDDMVNIARVFATRFGGTVLDEDHSVLTDQTVKYYKDKIRKFKLKSKLPQDKDLDKKAKNK